jgi:hypothetical protein
VGAVWEMIPNQLGMKSRNENDMKGKEKRKEEKMMHFAYT